MEEVAEKLLEELIEYHGEASYRTLTLAMNYNEKIEYLNGFLSMMTQELYRNIFLYTLNRGIKNILCNKDVLDSDFRYFMNNTCNLHYALENYHLAVKLFDKDKYMYYAAYIANIMFLNDNIVDNNPFNFIVEYKAGKDKMSHDLVSKKIIIDGVQILKRRRGM